MEDTPSASADGTPMQTPPSPSSTPPEGPPSPQPVKAESRDAGTTASGPPSTGAPASKRLPPLQLPATNASHPPTASLSAREEWMRKEDQERQRLLRPHPPPLLSPRKELEERATPRGGMVPVRNPAINTPRTAVSAGQQAAGTVNDAEKEKRELDRRLEEIGDLKRDKEYLRSELERITISLNVTKRQKEWREKEMGVIKERLTEREGTLKRREVELDIAKRQLEDRETRLRAKEVELGRLQSERREEKQLWEVRERQLTEQLRDQQRGAGGTKEDVAEWERQIEEKNSELERMRQYLVDNLQQLNAAQEANQSLTARLQAQAQTQERLEKEKKEAQDRVVEKKAKLKQIKEQMAEKEHEAEQARLQLEEQERSKRDEELLEAARAKEKRMELEIEEKDLRLRTLRAALDDRNAELEQAKRECAALEEQAARDLKLKELELDEIRKQLRAHEEVIREYEARVANMEREHELERRAEELRRQGELDAIERTIAKWMDEMRSIHKQSENDKRELSKAIEARDGFKAEADLHKRNADEAQARAKRCEERLAEAERSLALTREGAEHAQAAARKLETQVSALAANVAELEQSLDQTKSQAEKRERGLKEKLEALSSMKKEFQRTEKKLQKKAKKIVLLEQECHDKEAKINELSSELSAARKEVHEQEKKLRERSLDDTRQSAELSKELARREKERRELLLLVQEKESQLKERQQELEEERIRSRLRNEEAEHRLEEARTHEEKWRALKRENKSLRKRVQQLREQLEDQSLLREQHQSSLPSDEALSSASSSTAGRSGTDKVDVPPVSSEPLSSEPLASSVSAVSASDHAAPPSSPVVRTSQSLAEKRAVKRQRVIAEIVSTETSYVATLQTVIDVFLNPLRGPRNNLLPSVSVEAIFAGVEPLLAFHQRLLAQLQLAQQNEIERRQSEKGKKGNEAPVPTTTGQADATQEEEVATTGEEEDEERRDGKKSASLSVGDVFLEMGDGLMAYTTYVNNYGVAMIELRNAMAHYSAFATYASSESVMRTTRNLDIPSLLIAPIQRIPRYRLLLKELLESTEKDDESGSGGTDYEQVDLAYNKICNIAKTVDTRAAQHEDTQKAFRRIVGAEEWHEPERVLLKQSTFTVSSKRGGGSNMQVVYVFLFNDVVMEAKPIGERRLKKLITKNKTRSDRDIGSQQFVGSSDKSAVGRDLELDRVLDLREVEVVPLPVDSKRPERGFGLRIVAVSREGEKEQTVTVYTQREEDKTEWINAIYEAKNRLLTVEDEEEREKKLREAKGQVETLKESMMKKEDLVKKIEEKLFLEIKERTDRETRLRECEKELWRKNEEMESLRKELRRMEAKAERIEKEKRTFEDEVQRKDDELELRSEELAKVRKQLEVNERLLREREAALAKQEEDLEAVQEQKKQEMRAALEEERKLQEEIEKLQRDKSGEREKERLLSLIRKSEEKRELLERKVSNLRQVESALASEVTAMRKANEALRKEREASERESEEKITALRRSKDDEIQKLRKELQKRKDKIESLERDIEERQKTIGVKDMEARARDKELKELQDLLVRERDQYQALSREKAEREREISDREQDIVRLKADVARMTTDRESLLKEHRKNIDRLNRELRRSDKRRKQKKREMEQFMEESEKREEELRMELGDVLGKMEGMKTRLQETEELKQRSEDQFVAELAQKEEEIRQLGASITARTKELGDTRFELETLSREKDEKERRIQELNEEIAMMRAGKLQQELERRLEAKREECENLSRECNELLRQLEEVKSRREELLSEREDRTRDMEKMGGMITTLEEANKSLSSQVSLLTQANQENEELLREVRELLTREQEEATALKSANAKLAESVDKLEREFEETQKRLTADIDTAQSTKKDLWAKVLALTSEKEERAKEWDRILADLKTFSQAHGLGDLATDHLQAALLITPRGPRPSNADSGKGPIESILHQFTHQLVEAKLAQLKEELSEAHETHANELREIKEETGATIKKLKDKLNKLSAKLKDVKERERQLKIRVKELVVQNEGRNKELDRKRDELEKTIDISADVSQKLREQLERALREKDDLKARESQLRNELKEERTLHDGKKRELAKKIDEFNLLKKESEDQTKTARERIEELQWTLDQVTLSREASDYLQNLKKREEKQRAQAEHIVSLREKKKALAKALFTANADLLKAENTILRKDREHHAAMQSAEEKEKQLTERINQLNKEKKQWQERKKDLKRWGNKAIKRYRDKQKMYLKRLNELREARMEYVEVTKELRAKTRECKNLSKQIKGLQKDAEKRAQQIESLEHELARFQKRRTMSEEKDKDASDTSSSAETESEQASGSNTRKRRGLGLNLAAKIGESSMLFSLSPRGGGRASRSPDNSPSPLASKVASDGSSSVSFAPADVPKATTGNNRRARSASFDRTPSNVESGSGIKGRVGWKDEETSSHTGASDDDGDLRTISEADTESEQEDEEGSGSRISASYEEVVSDDERRTPSEESNASGVASSGSGIKSRLGSSSSGTRTADGKGSGKKRGSRVYRMMLNRKSGKSGRNLISLFLDEYARHTRELAKGEEAHLALLNEILDTLPLRLKGGKAGSKIQVLPSSTVDRIFDPLAALVPVHSHILALLQTPQPSLASSSSSASSEPTTPRERNKPSADSDDSKRESEEKETEKDADEDTAGTSAKKEAKIDVQTIWKEIGDKIKAYKQFVSDCGPAIYELRRALTTNATFASFCANNEALAKLMHASGCTDVMSLLLVPVQRLTHYRLALKEWMAYIGDAASGYDELSSILVRISSVEQLASSRVFRIQFTHNTLARIRNGETLLAPERALIKEGSFTAVRGRRTATVHLLLFNDLLVEAEEERPLQETKRLTIKIWETAKPDASSGSKPPELIIRQAIPLSESVHISSLPDSRKEKHGMKVSSSEASSSSTSSSSSSSSGSSLARPDVPEEGTIVVFAKSDIERAEWIKLIEQQTSSPSSSSASLNAPSSSDLNEL